MRLLKLNGHRSFDRGCRGCAADFECAAITWSAHQIKMKPGWSGLLRCTGNRCGLDRGKVTRSNAFNLQGLMRRHFRLRSGLRFRRWFVKRAAEPQVPERAGVFFCAEVHRDSACSGSMVCSGQTASCPRFLLLAQSGLKTRVPFMTRSPPKADMGYGASLAVRWSRERLVGDE